jgi:hypothetical protein
MTSLTSNSRPAIPRPTPLTGRDAKSWRVRLWLWALLDGTIVGIAALLLILPALDYMALSSGGDTLGNVLLAPVIFFGFAAVANYVSVLLRAKRLLHKRGYPSQAYVAWTWPRLLGAAIVSILFPLLILFSSFIAASIAAKGIERLREP